MIAVKIKIKGIINKKKIKKIQKVENVKKTKAIIIKSLK